MNHHSKGNLDSTDFAPPSGPHGPAHEEWLGSVLAAGRSASDAAVRGQLERCAECAREFHALFSVTQRIDREALLEKEILAEAKGPVLGGANEFVLRQQGEVDRYMRERLAAKPKRESAWKRSFTLRVAAAAATVAVATWIVKRLVPTGSNSGPRIVLGTSQWTSLSPAAVMSPRTTFRWSFELPAGGWYVLRVESAEPGQNVDTPLHLSDPLYEPQWQPTDEELAKWPESIRWSVSAYDATGQILGTSPASSVRLVSSAR